MKALQFRWPIVMLLAGVAGCLPFTISGLPEFFAIAAVPFFLGFLITRLWSDRVAQLTLSMALPLFGAGVRLASSSLLDGSNWFARFFRATDAVGISDPYVRQGLVTLLFPVFVTVVVTIVFMIFPRGAHARDA